MIYYYIISIISISAKKELQTDITLRGYIKLQNQERFASTSSFFIGQC